MGAQANLLPSVSAFDGEKLPRHRWYFFKEAFSPAIVDHAITDARLPRSATVFDPFSGSGTTALTAGLSGLRGSGTEVNPFLRFVARAKASSPSVADFDRAMELALQGASVGVDSALLRFSTFSELAPKAKARGKWLFNSDVLRAFQGGWRAVQSSRSSHRLVRLCLIGAAMDAANAAKDGKCLRFRTKWQELSLGSDQFAEALERRASEVRQDLQLSGDQNIDVNIRLGDSRASRMRDKFDLCVTSPPYLNSFDYTDVYRPELFLGGFVSDMAELRALRLAAVRSHLQAAWKDPTKSDFGSLYAESIRDLRSAFAEGQNGNKHLWNGRIPVMVQAYFEDMERVLKRLRKSASPGASVWLVVSTSAYGGVEIPVDLIIGEIAGRCGWFLREVSVLRYLRRLAGQQWKVLSERDGIPRPHLRESVVILDARPSR